MKRVMQCLLLLALLSLIAASGAVAGGLAGVWSLDISDYKNTCGGKPTAAKELSLTQDGRKLAAAIGVKGDDGKTYTGTFHGSMDQEQPPAKASLYGKFEVAGFNTEETIQIKFLDQSRFAGASQWKTQSADKKITCEGSQKIAGRKK
ncbi:MAG: hypothetical protein K9K65_01630 [Desulfarculaceae bacterium]|nr:hypothetical protein [Desulfarculaceae bacterium]MCF8047010.1 hypothetical protein [Desulfarculaceae bacterium]MCF8066358.1 hypothetical protein [Desulfarculaceae bacterium]MCF8096518.1 hypothetical protein [Desulfarculaceae bacterium]MCF8121772.1 hypothetical protein [Desulfarculaceae bacterium]